MKTIKSKSHWLIPFLIGAAIAGGAVTTALPARSSASAVDREIIAKEVRKELQHLIESGQLDDAIEKGIESYIQKMRVAEAARKKRAQSEHARKLRPVSPERDHIYGNPDAPISLVEYSDFECPFCKRFHPTAKQLVEQSGGKVNLVYRHFPLDFHNPGAEKEAEAAECAAALGGNDAFWRYADLIYARTRSNGNGLAHEKLVPLAEEAGLDKQSFAQCLNSGKMARRVKADYEDGVKAGITGTPGLIFLNHESGDLFATAGAQPLSRLQAIVGRLLSAQGRTK